MAHAEEDARLDAERARIAKQPNEIGAKHILVMHDDSQQKPDTSRARATRRGSAPRWSSRRSAAAPTSTRW